MDGRRGLVPSNFVEKVSGEYFTYFIDMPSDAFDDCMTLEKRCQNAALKLGDFCCCHCLSQIAADFVNHDDDEESVNMGPFTHYQQYRVRGFKIYYMLSEGGEWVRSFITK
jgi:hypothetical protein